MNTEFNMKAEEACFFLRRQLNKLSSVVSVKDAEGIMREVSDYTFPQINGNLFYDTPLVRCVKIDKEKEIPDSITIINRFSYPPAEVVTKPARMNIPSSPVFYSANDIRTSLLESTIKEGDDFYAGVWGIKNDVRMLTFPSIPYNVLCKLAESGDEKIEELKEIVDRHPSFKQLLGIMEEIFSIPHDVVNPKADNTYIYYLSGAIAHSLLTAKVINGKQLYTDAIMYPSVKTICKTYNLTIRPDFVRQNMKLLYVVKGKLNEGRLEYSFNYVGFNENGGIVWKQMRKRITELKVTKISNESGIHSPHPNETIRFDGKDYTIPMFEHYAYGKLNNQDSPLKGIKFDKDNDIDIMDPTWVRKWEEDTEQYLVLVCDNKTEIQLWTTINSYFSSNGVEIEKVFAQ